jgi:signal transduction histidine kinase
MLTVSIITIGMLMMVLYIMMKELVLRPVNQLKGSIEDFSRGRNTQTAAIRTGDELEELGNSFIEMSRTLSEYHADLEGKVHQATIGLERANERLVELNEKKSDFIAKISHELRTPMTSIKGAMDYLKVRVPGVAGSGADQEEIMEFLDVIKKNADRLIRMVNDTLDLERIESGMFDLECSSVDILSLIKEVVLSFQSVTSVRGITFTIKSAPGMIVHADQDRIGQVLINLISNAIAYSPDNSGILITVEETEGKVVTTIRDEGPGIPDELHEKIFDKFYTVGNRPGTGLGLAISKGIIEAHKGQIQILKGMTRGSALSFTLNALPEQSM